MLNQFKYLLKHPLAVFTVFAMASLLGLFLLFSLPMDLYPEFNPPVLSIVTVYPQASPLEIKEQITEPLEEKLGSISGLEKMSSYSGHEVSRIVLEFLWTVSMDGIENELRSRLGQMEQTLPEFARKPVLYKYDMNDEPIVELAVRSVDDGALSEITSIIEDQIKPSFEQLEGIAAVEIAGIRNEQVEISAVRNRLEAFSLNLLMVSKILEVQNKTLGSGVFNEDGLEYIIQTEGKFNSLEDIRNTVISYPGRVPVRIRDFAIVKRVLEDPKGKVLFNGKPAVRISIMKQSDAHVIQATDQVLDRVHTIGSTLPEGMVLEVISESTGLIRLVIKTIMTSGIFGGLLAMGVILFFLHRIKLTLIIFLTIPVSLLFAVGGLAAFGKTLNLLTMGGLILGMGMIVDSSIVVLESIISCRDKGSSLRVAALTGVSEVASPIIGSTLTSVCVFIPLLFMSKNLDILGAMFKDMALSVILALTASLMASLILVPALSLYLLKEKKAKTTRIDRIVSFLLKKLEQLYAALLKKTMENRGWVICTSLVLLLTSFFVFPRLGWQFLPVTGEESFIIDADFPPGTSIDAVEETLKEVAIVMEKEFSWIKGVLITAETGKGRLTGMLPSLNSRPISHARMKEQMRHHFPVWPSVEFVFRTTDMAAELGNSGKLILKIQGDSEEKLRDTESKLLRLLQNRFEFLELKSDREKDRPAFSAVLLRDRAFQLGINMEQAVAEIRAAISGMKATEFRVNAKSYDVIVRLREEDRMSRQDLNRLFIINDKGMRVPMSNIARLEDDKISGGVRRENQVNTIQLTGHLHPEADTDLLIQWIEEQSLSIVPEGVSISFAGEMEDVQQYGRNLFFVFAIAVLLVFTVMVCQFESLSSPFIIILLLPFMLIGIVLCFLFFGLPVNMITIIGVVMLAGIVVNNGIIMVDHIQSLIRKGKYLKDACIEASQRRLRPVLMTTATTVVAMIPMGFFPGSGGRLLQPLGLTIAGGLSVSMLVTLFLIPTLFSLFHERIGISRAKINEGMV